MKLGATKKTRPSSATQTPERAQALSWIDEILVSSSELQASLAGLGLNHDQRDRLFQEIAGQLRRQRQIHPRTAAALHASVDAPRLSGKVGVPLNVVRSALEMLARTLERTC